ncbi:MAG: hypothetical protein WCP46_09740 [Alphaproteobacteria bacterium]
MKKTILIAMLMVCSALMATLPNRPGDRERFAQQRQATKFEVISRQYQRDDDGTVVNLGARVQLSFNGNIYYDSADKYIAVPTALAELLVFNTGDKSLEERVRKFFEAPTEYSITFKPLPTVVLK